jgi:DNA-binding transcriptional regulator YhcF (GntR family)
MDAPVVTIDVDGALPLEEQLCRQLRQLIARKDLRPGQALPSVRQLAADLGIHWNTVARAYRRLREEGLLRIGIGRGVTVSARSAQRAGADAIAEVREEVRQLAANARLRGVTPSELRRLILGELESWSERKEKA